MSDDFDDDDELEHPALKHFNEGGYKMQHVAGKTLKAALIGAVVGAVALTAMAAAAAVFSIPFGGLLAMIGLTTEVGAGFAGAAALKALTVGAIAGGGLGAAVGLATGATSADEAADQRKEDIVAQAERMEIRKERAEAVKMQKYQQEAMAQVQAEQMGLSPQTGLPQKAPGGPLIGG